MKNMSGKRDMIFLLEQKAGHDSLLGKRDLWSPYPEGTRNLKAIDNL